MIACFYIFSPRSEAGEASEALPEKLCRDVTLFVAARTPAVERSPAPAWFVDLRGCDRLLRGDFAGWGVQVAGLLARRFPVAVQVGLGSNKVTAELACRLACRGSVLRLFREGEEEAVRKARIDQLPRLTEAQRQVFRDKRLTWVWEARAMGEDSLRLWLGNREGSDVWRVLHGVCDDPVKPWRAPRVLRKSFTFPDPTASLQDIVRAGIYLMGALYHESRKLEAVFRKLSCELLYVDGLKASREIHVLELGAEEDYAAAVARMLEHLPLRRVQAKSLHLQCRLEFEAAEQQDLFSERERLKRRDLDQVLREVREKYGVESLHRASGTARRRPGAGEWRR